MVACTLRITNQLLGVLELFKNVSITLEDLP